MIIKIVCKLRNNATIVTYNNTFNQLEPLLIKNLKPSLSSTLVSISRLSKTCIVLIFVILPMKFFNSSLPSQCFSHLLPNFLIPARDRSLPSYMEFNELSKTSTLKSLPVLGKFTNIFRSFITDQLKQTHKDLSKMLDAVTNLIEPKIGPFTSLSFNGFPKSVAPSLTIWNRKLGNYCGRQKVQWLIRFVTCFLNSARTSCTNSSKVKPDLKFVQIRISNIEKKRRTKCKADRTVKGNFIVT